MSAHGALLVVVREDGAEDILDVAQVGELFVLTGYQPPRFIKRAPTPQELQDFVESCGLFTITSIHLY